MCYMVTVYDAGQIIISVVRAGRRNLNRSLEPLIFFRSSYKQDSICARTYSMAGKIYLKTGKYLISAKPVRPVNTLSRGRRG